MDRYQQFRQFISNFIDGPNAQAWFESIVDQLQQQDDLAVAVTDQLSICTSSGIYLDKQLAAKGITRPGDLGMDDLAYKEMGISINQAKLITEAIHVVLATFYGDPAVRAYTISGIAGPYIFNPGDDLQFVLENGQVNTLTLVGDEFEDPSQATTEEIVDVITRYIRSLGSDGYAQTNIDVDTGLKYVQIFGGAKGPFSLIQIVGGRIQDELEFPEIRPTFLPSNTTVWEITRNIGDTYRFRWISGPQPLLDQIFPGDSVMIYGQQFNDLGFDGTFTITNSRPPQPVPAADAGFFEIQMPLFTGPNPLSSIAPNTVPPPNSPPTYFSFTVTQALYSDLKFFLPKKNTPYANVRYALAWEPADSLLKIYMPASTMVVKRDLIGGAHVHLLYAATELNGSFGSATDQTSQVIVVNDYAIKYPQRGYDVSATGGNLTYGLNSIPIDHVFREQGFTTVVTTVPHGITGVADSFGQLFSTTVVGVIVGQLLTDDPVNKFLGPYMVDETAPYTLTSEVVTLREEITAGQNKQTIQVSGQLANQAGQLLFALNQDNEESPVRYLAAQSASSSQPVNISTISQNGTTVTVTTQGPHGLIPNQSAIIAGTVNFNGEWTVLTTPSIFVYTFMKTPSATIFESVGTSTPVVANAITTLIMDTSYSFKHDHSVGEDITLLSDTKAYTPEPDGTDYGFYVTGTANGRIFAQQIIQSIVAAGINLQIIIIYPNDEGLGNAGDSTLPGVTPQSDATYVWGGD